MENDPIIEFRHVWKGYSTQQVLKDISIRIAKGEFLTIIGGSGSGKTTFMKLVNGLLIADKGEIFVERELIGTSNLINLRRNIGYAIQSIALFPHLTVRKNIIFVLALNGKHKTKNSSKQVIKMMKMLDLDESLLNRYPSELSGGQQQRVGIARALVSSPPLLLMDEPFGAVDEITRQGLQKVILHIHHELGTTILFVTHDIQEAMKLGTRVLILKEGEIEQVDTPTHIRQYPASEYVISLLQSRK